MELCVDILAEEEDQDVKSWVPPNSAGEHNDGPPSVPPVESTVFPASRLLQMLLAILAVNAAAPGAGDPWDTWRSFKQFARASDEIPDPGMSVQLLKAAGGSIRLVFLRQVLEPEGDWLSPIGGVVCELCFDGPPSAPEEREYWTFDYASFERFVDAVEQDTEFAGLMARFPKHGRVYWLDA